MIFFCCYLLCMVVVFFFLVMLVVFVLVVDVLCVLFKISMGDIILELNFEKVLVLVDNFLKYVKKG